MPAGRLCFAVALALGSIAIGPRCDRIPDKVTAVDAKFTRMEENTVFSSESFNFLNASKPGLSANFTGVKLCSVWVNERLDSVPAPDSVSASITFDKDTVVPQGDSVRGVPKFSSGDLLNWKTIGYIFDNPDFSLYSKIFKAGIDSARYDSIKQFLDTITKASSRPPDAWVTSIVSALNTALSDVNFFHANIDMLNFAVVMGNYTDRLALLVNEGIFLDSTGTAKQGMNSYEKAAVEWFTMTLLVSNAINTFPSGKNLTPALSDLPLCERVCKFDFQQSLVNEPQSTRSAVWIFSFNTQKTALVSCRENDGSVEREFNQFRDTTLLTIPFITGTSWSVAPLIWFDVPLIPADKLMSVLQPGRASAQFNTRLSLTFFPYVDMTLYYPLNGALAENGGSQAYFLGYITVRLRLKDDQTAPHNPAVITNWDTDIHVLKTDRKENTEVWNESYRLQNTAPY